MEIYKLSDEIPTDKRAQRSRTSGGKGDFDGDLAVGETGSGEDETGADGVLTITDLRQGVKNPNRVNVFVNEKYAFSLDVAQIVDLGVKIGRVVSQEELSELKRASEFGKEYQRALEWVLVRPRSVRELKDYLRRREMLASAKERKREWEYEREIADLVAKGEDVEKMQKRRPRKREKYDFSELILERLSERGYADDRKFAEYYVENRFVKKGISRRRLEMELMKKGVAKEIIGEVLAQRNDETEIKKIIAKKRAKYDDEKLISYLCRQGFSYDLVRDLIEKEY